MQAVDRTTDRYIFVDVFMLEINFNFDLSCGAEVARRAVLQCGDVDCNGTWLNSKLIW
jgi:hypothetical protein